MGDEVKRDPPAGTKPLFIQMRNLEKYGLKTGPALADVLPYKFMHRKTILDEIQSLGVYSDFHPFTKDIETYPEEEFLVMGDPQQVYGDSFLLVYSVETKNGLIEQLKARAEAEEAAKRAIEEEELKRKAEEEARLNAVYVDKPFVPRPWVSETEQETLEEIGRLNIKPKRELFALSISRPRDSFRKAYTFGDRDTAFDGAIEYRSHKDPAFDLIRKEADIAVQAAPQSATLSTQTTYYRPVNKAVQFDNEHSNATASSSSSSSMVDGSSASSSTVVVTTSMTNSNSSGKEKEGGLAAAGLGLLPGMRNTSMIGIAGGADAGGAGSDAAGKPGSSNSTRTSASRSSGKPQSAAAAAAAAATSSGSIISIPATAGSKAGSTTSSGNNHRGGGGAAAANNQQQASITPEGQMAEFLKKVRPLMEEALQQNETVNIFQDVFKALGTEDDSVHAVVTKKGENELKELRAFSSLLYSKNKPLSAIDWHPKKKGMVAVAPTRSITFSQRMEMDGMASTSHILVWDFIDFSSPQFVLQAPHEVFTFRFNPTSPNVVVAGSFSGQLLLWDCTQALDLISQKRGRMQRGASGGRGKGNSVIRKDGDGDDDNDDDDDKSIAPVMPLAASHIDSSHKRPVAEVIWLPSNIQVNSKGQVLGEEHLDGISYQILSVAGDGQVLIWDTRYEAIADGQYPHIARPRPDNKSTSNTTSTSSTTAAAALKEPAKPHWLPLFRLQLKRPEGGVGELSLCRVASAYPAEGGSAVDSSSSPPYASALDADDSLKSRIYLATEEGEILAADWRSINRASSSTNGPTSKASEEEGGGGGAGGEGGGGGAVEVNHVEWMEMDHPRPCVTLQRSPFFGDIYMTVGDWNFRLWKIDVKAPIFTSANSSTYITVGRWSTTRPGVVLIAKADGSLDVWDFTDSSYRPSITLMCSPSKITSMEFLLRPHISSTGSNKQQLLAVGDANGNLHIFNLPHHLWKPLPSEKLTIRKFLDRELKKMDYVNQRLIYRREEAEKLEKEREAAAITAAQTPSSSQPHSLASSSSASKAAASSISGESSIAPEEIQLEEPEDPEVTAMQAIYLEMEKDFVDKMALKEEDLPPGYIVPASREEAAASTTGGNSRRK